MNPVMPDFYDIWDDPDPDRVQAILRHAVDLLPGELNEFRCEDLTMTIKNAVDRLHELKFQD